MFAIGVDEMSWDDLNPNNYRWPEVAAVRDYRARMKAVVREVIRTLPIELPVGWLSPAWAILMGIEHERIHLETSSVLIRQTALEHIKPADDPVHAFWTRCPNGRADPRQVPANELLPVPGGRVVLGKARDHNLYGWDNEYGRHEAEIAPFRASRFSGQQHRVPRLRRGRWLRATAVVDRGGKALARVPQGATPAVLAACRRPLALPGPARRDRHALGLAGGRQLAGGQGLLQLEIRTNRTAAAPADRGRVGAPPRPLGHPGRTRLGPGRGGARQHQPGALGERLPGGPLRLPRRLPRRGGQRLAMDRDPHRRLRGASRCIPGTTTSPPPPSTTSTT